MFLEVGQITTSHQGILYDVQERLHANKDYIVSNLITKHRLRQFRLNVVTKYLPQLVRINITLVNEFISENHESLSYP